MRQRDLSVGADFIPGHLVFGGGKLRRSDGYGVIDFNVLRILRGKSRSGYKTIRSGSVLQQQGQCAKPQLLN
jgi:hypothetical protein